MSTKMYCMSAGYPCGNTNCEKNIARAHCGCAVSCQDFSDGCKDYQPRIIVRADTWQMAVTAIKNLACINNQSVERTLRMVEIKGLPVSDIAEVLAALEGDEGKCR